MRAGDRVQLRDPAEILATLDGDGCLDGLPFMPEMLSHFGKTFTVRAQATRPCDTITYSGVRRLARTVILDDLRCDGSGHADCGAQCRLYWKEAWLRPATAADAPRGRSSAVDLGQLERRARMSVAGAGSTRDSPTFRCQATELLHASEPVGWYSFSSFVGELKNGNVGLGRFVRVMTRAVSEELAKRLNLMTYDPFRPSDLKGQRSAVSPSPNEFRPGQLVRIKTPDRIQRTLAEDGKNRGLWFDREMLPYCGRQARVKAKVERFIDEQTGELRELKSDCYILDDVVCGGDRSEHRWFCPRAIYPWWRECWLEAAE